MSLQNLSYIMGGEASGVQTYLSSLYLPSLTANRHHGKEDLVRIMNKTLAGTTGERWSNEFSLVRAALPSIASGE
ncbi:hypothetical protein PsorP6_012020 [Peronosclerospora sorghi]|uniref:Uncharacterized protein n=1 Tax=Peronosclerospora sorghi TaxID=230839 RepID=A0ACC0WLE7_9STRA|nr:hypothetical protein PsorP6_012020 [Peronosclerospora sorghi]